MADAVTMRTAELLCELTALVGRLSDRIRRLEVAAQAQPSRARLDLPSVRDPAHSGPNTPTLTDCQP